MDIQEAIRSRRTIHSFNTRMVPEKFVQRAIEAANHAPCHRLTFPWRFTRLNRKKRQLLAELAVEKRFYCRKIDEGIKEKIYAKILNSSHLLVASQILTEDPKTKLEDYAACSCAIQNLCLSLVSDGIGSKWSTGNITTEKNTYEIVGINSNVEQIIGFIWIGYGETPPQINRPLIETIFRR